jgi:hypothetical protein
MSDAVWGIIIGVLVTMVVGWLSTRSTNKRLNMTMHVLSGLIEGSIKGNQVRVRKNNKGELVGLNLVVTPDPIQVHVGENVIDILKKANEEAPMSPGEK